MKIHSLLLAGTAFLSLAAVPPSAQAAMPDGVLILAQANTPPLTEEQKKKLEEERKKAAPPKPAPPAAAPPPPRPQAAPPPAAAPKPPTPPAVQAPRPAQAPARTQAPPTPAPSAPAVRQERREERRDQRQDQRQVTPPPAPPTQAAPPAARTTPPPNAPARQERREDRRDQRQATPPAPAQVTPPTPPAAQTAPSTAPSTPPAARTTPPPAASSTPPAAATTPPPATPPAANRPQQRQSAPTPAAPPPTAAPQQATPPAARSAPSAPAAATTAPQPAATVAPPTQPRDAREFIRRDNQAPARTMDQLRQERRQTQQGGRTLITEGDRTIVKQGDRTIIRHNEANRFAIGASNVRTDRRGNQTTTVIARPNGISIVSVTGDDGRLIRRVRRDARGRQVIIIDNSFVGARRDGFFINLAPPRIRIPRERYIVEAWDAPRDYIYGVFMAPPVERIERRYTLDEVRYSEPLRARMPRVDLDVTFETGSWQLTPEQIDKLSVIAEGLNRALARNPREVFMIEGHTDAVGAPEDNLSLSDRRAEAVAVALAEQFQVPAENLVTQGYGEEHLKEPSDGPSRVNRRVAIRRITPLIDQQAAR